MPSPHPAKDSAPGQPSGEWPEVHVWRDYAGTLCMSETMPGSNPPIRTRYIPIQRLEEAKVECRKLEDANRSLAMMRDAALEGNLATALPHPASLTDERMADFLSALLPEPEACAAVDRIRRAPSNEVLDEAVEDLIRFALSAANRYTVDRLAEEACQACGRPVGAVLCADCQGAKDPALHELGKRLSVRTLKMAKRAIVATWNVQPDDAPSPNAATLAWREIRAAINKVESEGER